MPILPALFSVNQRLPSEPAVIAHGEDAGVGTGNSVIESSDRGSSASSPFCVRWKRVRFRGRLEGWRCDAVNASHIGVSPCDKVAVDIQRFDLSLKKDNNREPNEPRSIIDFGKQSSGEGYDGSDRGRANASASAKTAFEMLGCVSLARPTIRAVHAAPC
jgi:hypothetical protein